MSRQPLVSQPSYGWGFLSHSDTPHSVGLLWRGDQPDAETSTGQHTTLIRDIHAPPGFEPAIPASERQQTYVIDRAVTGVGNHTGLHPEKSKAAKMWWFRWLYKAGNVIAGEGLTWSKTSAELDWTVCLKTDCPWHNSFRPLSCWFSSGFNHSGSHKLHDSLFMKIAVGIPTIRQGRHADINHVLEY
jgi:hypothetical protein